MRFIVPIFLILISIVGFFTLISPALQDVKMLKAEMSSYDEALDNARELAEERDKLTKQFNSFAPRNLERLQTLLPNSVNNIRLILEIEDIASPYGMLLRDVKYDTSRENGTDPECSSSWQPNPKSSTRIRDLDFRIFYRWFLSRFPKLSFEPRGKPKTARYIFD